MSPETYAPAPQPALSVGACTVGRSAEPRSARTIVGTAASVRVAELLVIRASEMLANTASATATRARNGMRVWRRIGWIIGLLPPRKAGYRAACAVWRDLAMKHFTLWTNRSRPRNERVTGPAALQRPRGSMTAPGW